MSVVNTDEDAVLPMSAAQSHNISHGHSAALKDDAAVAAQDSRR